MDDPIYGLMEMVAEQKLLHTAKKTNKLALELHDKEFKDEELRNRILLEITPYVIGICNKYIGRLHIPTKNDLVQDVLLHCLRKIDRYNPEKGKFSTYIYKIVQVHLLDKHRQFKRKVEKLKTGYCTPNTKENDRGFEDTLIGRIIDRRRSPQEVEAKEVWELMQEVCTEEEVVVLEMRCNGYTVEQIANKYGTSKQTIKNTEKRGLKRLARIAGTENVSIYTACSRKAK